MSPLTSTSNSRVSVAKVESAWWTQIECWLRRCYFLHLFAPGPNPGPRDDTNQMRKEKEHKEKDKKRQKTATQAAEALEEKAAVKISQADGLEGTFVLACTLDCTAGEQ